MKFTKEEARKELSTLMTAKGEKLNLSERSLNEQLEALIPLLANEETELADFVSKVLPIFKTADANVRNDVSAGINKYKSENPVTPKQNEEQEVHQDDDLTKRIADLEAKIANAERERRAGEKRNEIIMKLKEKGVKDEEWVNALLSEVNISDDFDFDTKVDAYISLYNKAQTHFDPNATSGGANGGGNAKKDIQDAIKEASRFVSESNLNA